MKNYFKNISPLEFIIGVFAFIFAIVGVIILLIFIIQLKEDYQFIGTNKVLLDKTGQVGDFIGGLVGSIWAFAGVLLFFLALRVQRKELNTQVEELKLQREEFTTNRITNVVYKQIELVEKIIDNFIPLIRVNKNNGIHAIKYLLNNDYKSGKSFEDREKVFRQMRPYYEDLFRQLANNCKVVDRILKAVPASEFRKELKSAFIINIDSDVFLLSRLIFSDLKRDLKDRGMNEENIFQFDCYELYLHVDSIDKFAYDNIEVINNTSPNK